MNEKEWCSKICTYFENTFIWGIGSEQERRLWDGTRVDIITDDFAFEIDWVDKWAEGIGQCLWYAENTSKRPALLLLIPDMMAQKQHVYRAKCICIKYDIDLWLVDTVKEEMIDPDGLKHLLDGYPHREVKHITQSYGVTPGIAPYQLRSQRR